MTAVLNTTAHKRSTSPRPQPGTAIWPPAASPKWRTRECDASSVMAKPTSRSRLRDPAGSPRTLDNLTFAANGNLQRVDGPGRGNNRILDELASVFAGAGWHALKVLWGSESRTFFAQPVGAGLGARLAAKRVNQLPRHRSITTEPIIKKRRRPPHTNVRPGCKHGDGCRVAGGTQSAV
jgi:hypothetical protein